MENRIPNKTCCVLGCSQATRQRMKGTVGNISFHTFPRKKEIREKWIISVQRQNGGAWFPKKDSRLCSIHFGEYCWEKVREDGKRKLKWQAVPLYIEPTPMQPPPYKKDVVAFDHPYCSGVFKQRSPFSEVTNIISSSEHSYSKEGGRSVEGLGVNKSLSSSCLQTPYSSQTQGIQKKTVHVPAESVLQNPYGTAAGTLASLSSPLHDTAPLLNSSCFSIDRTNPTPAPNPTEAMRTAAEILASLSSPQTAAGTPLQVNSSCFTVSATSATLVLDPAEAVHATDTEAWRDVNMASHENVNISSEISAVNSSFSCNANSSILTLDPTEAVHAADTETCRDVNMASDANFDISSEIGAVNTSFSCNANSSILTSDTGPTVLQSFVADFNSHLRSTTFTNAFVERQKDEELASAREESRRLREQVKALTDLASKLNKQNVRLRQSNRVVTRRNVAITNKCKNLELKTSAVFNEDQIEAMSRKSTRGIKWNPATIKDALILKMKCGTSGYEELRKKLPYPSARTLQRHVQHIVFASGMLEEVFDMISADIRNMKEEELDCVLAGDEMSIDPGERVDPSTGKPIGRVTLQSHQGVANKALVFILGGISTRWKQTVAYFFTRSRKEMGTPDSVGKEVADIIVNIIRRAEEVGLRVHCVTSDMGPDNRAVWRHFGIGCTRDNCTYAIPHPVRSRDSLCFVPDVPHLFKSLKKMLLSNQLIFLPEDIVEEEDLPTNIVDARHFQDLLDAEKGFELKIAPRLREDTLKPKHFQTMKVGNARAVINRRTSTGLQVLALETQDPSYITTAWFVEQVNKWFDLMTSRCFKMALSKTVETKYQEGMNHLEKVVRLFNTMRVGQDGHWKPVQTGVILATKSIVHLQNDLLNTRNFRFVLTSRFSQDFLENLFSSIRARQSVPHALAFKNILKVVTIAQYCRRALGSSYDFDEGGFLLDFLAVTKAKKAERLAAAAVVPEQPTISVADIPRASDSDINSYFSYWERLIVYDMAGAALLSVKKNFTVCDDCYNACLHLEEEPHSYSVITHLNAYTSNALVEVSDECYKALAKAELVFRSTRQELMSSTNVNVQEVLVSSLNEYVWCGSRIPTCHNIRKQLLRRYLAIRWMNFGQRRTLEERAAAKQVYGSKSMAMHSIVR